MEPAERDALARQAANGDRVTFASIRAYLGDTTARYVEYKAADQHGANRLADEMVATAWDCMPARAAEVAFSGAEEPSIPLQHWFLRVSRNAVIRYYRAHPGAIGRWAPWADYGTITVARLTPVLP